MSFTPGPWAEIDRSSSYINIVGNPVSAVGVPAGGLEKVCRVIRHRPGEANARLIKVAPELLESLKALVEIFEGDDESQTPGTDAYTAIGFAKAVIEEAVQS